MKRDDLIFSSLKQSIHLNLISADSGFRGIYEPRFVAFEQLMR